MKNYKANSVKLFFVLLILSNTIWSQQLIEESIFSKEANDSIALKIRLPMDHSPNKKYPVIYEFIYDHTDLIAASLNNAYSLPNSIVVFPNLKTGQGYYKSPDLDAEGESYFRALKNDIIPYIEKQYGASRYRIAAGLSMGADYANYVLRNDPNLFKAFMIFAIEKSPEYEADISTYYKNVKDETTYFIALTHNDLERRILFANDIYVQFAYSKKFRIKKKEYPEVEHSYVLLFGIPDALYFVFDEFINYRKKRPDENSFEYYTSVQKEYQEKYGIGANINNFIMEMMDGIQEDEDPKSIEDFVEQIYADENVKSSDLYNIGYKLTNLKLYEQSERALLYAKELFLTDTRNNLGPMMPYQGLGRLYEKQKDFKKAEDILMEGYKLTKDNILLYKIGFLAINNNYKIEEGIQAIQKAHENKLYSDELVYSFIAVGYKKLKKNRLAKEYAQKTLMLNPENKTALKIISDLKD